MKLTEGYDKLSKTFNPKQRRIANETDFNQNMGEMVGLMRKQIEDSQQEAKLNSKRFYASTIVAAASVIVAVIAILLA